MKGCWEAVIFLTLLACNVIARSTDNVNYDRENKRETGSMLAEIAKELIQRSTSGSQVLNLNLSNLLLLLVLKAVVFGAGYIGNQGYRGREIKEEGEVALALGYLIGDTCLYRAACEAPNTAKEYLGAVEMIFQTLKLMPQSVQLGDGYERTIGNVRKAIEYGTMEQCPPEYTCKKESIQSFLRPE